MAVDRVRPHFFVIDVGSDFVLDVFWPPSRPVWSPVFVRTSPRVSAKAALTAQAYARRMRCEIYLTTSSLATCICQSVYDSGVLSINYLRLWAICTHTLAEKGESISVAGACMTGYEPAARKGVECRLGGSIIKIAFRKKRRMYEFWPR
jgi:hypothetical protein